MCRAKLVQQLQLGLVMAGVIYVTADRATYWDGKTESGESVAYGAYFYQLQAGDYTETRRDDTETEIEGTKRLRDLVLRAVDVLESGLDSENERIR